MTRLVIDASIVVKWIVAEEGTAEAVSLLTNDSQLAAPDLLISECSNILWKKVRRQELTGQEAMLGARLLQQAEIELHPMRALLEPATQLALDLNHAACDCVYIALAEKYGWQFVTADMRLVAKVRQSKHACREIVISLAEAAGSLEGKH